MKVVCQNFYKEWSRKKYTHFRKSLVTSWVSISGHVKYPLEFGQLGNYVVWSGNLSWNIFKFLIIPRFLRERDSNIFSLIWCLIVLFIVHLWMLWTIRAVIVSKVYRRTIVRQNSGENSLDPIVIIWVESWIYRIATKWVKNPTRNVCLVCEWDIDKCVVCCHTKCNAVVALDCTFRRR